MVHRPGQLALPPAEDRFNFGDAIFVGCRYYYGGQFNIGRESIYQSDDREKIIYYASDYQGADIGYPATAGGFTVEGLDGISGVIYHTVKRDANDYRPTKVVGMRVEEGFGGLLSHALLESGVKDEGLGKFNSPNGLLNELFEGSEDYIHGEFEIFDFEYNTESGLLTTITETLISDGSIEKIIHQNYFDDNGRRVGYIKQEFVEVNAASQEEVYDITQLSLFEFSPVMWREYAYTGFQDGLIPWYVNEGDPENFPPLYKINYLRPTVESGKLNYLLAAVHGSMMLHKTAAIGESGPGGIAVPAWIPKSRVCLVARREMRIDDAACPVYFSEIENTNIMWPGPAFTLAESCGDNDKATNFINYIANRQTVILHTLEDQFPVMQQVMHRVYLGYEPLNANQHLSIIAALHPVFGREQLIPLSPLERSNDRKGFVNILNALNISANQVRAALSDFQNLSEASRNCFEYLVNIFNGQ